VDFDLFSVGIGGWALLLLLMLPLLNAVPSILREVNAKRSDVGPASILHLFSTVHLQLLWVVPLGATTSSRQQLQLPEVCCVTTSSLDAIT